MAGIVHLKPLLSLGFSPLLSLSCCFSLGLQQASAQIIPDNTLGLEQSRITNVNDIRELIEGGAIRDSNLFHSFEQFNIGEGREVYFANPAGIENILGRVTGNDISNIFGTLGVDGMANLFLINPNGIIFGPNARLDIGGSFVASTADSFAFADGSSFSAENPEAPPLLTINVTPGLQYGRRQPAPVVNTGNLGVGQAQSLTLTGGNVVTTGELSAPGGYVSLAAVPGNSLVQLGETGELLTWAILPRADTEIQPDVSRVSVTELLDFTGVENANLPVDIQLGTTLVSGGVDTSDVEHIGGTIQVLGNRVGVLDAEINASGLLGGGNVLIGGNYQGQGLLPNASITYISEDSVTQADALVDGNGGQIIIWSDDTTRIFGSISARGGINFGNGGFVETSSLGFLNIAQNPDISASNGLGGTWLIDPNNIDIVGGSGNIGIPSSNPFIATSENAQLGVNLITSALTDGSNVVVSTNTFGNQEGNITLVENAVLDFNGTGENSLTLQAANDILIKSKIFDSLTGDDSINLFFRADIDDNGQGGILIDLVDGRIVTGGGNINFTGSYVRVNGELNSKGGNIELLGNQSGIFVIDPISSEGGNINLVGIDNGNGNGINVRGSSNNRAINSGGGNISITGVTNRNDCCGINIGGSINASIGDLILTADTIRFREQGLSSSGSGNLIIQPFTLDGNFIIDSGRLPILKENFASITIGRSDGNGIVNMKNTSFNSPVLIQSPLVNGKILIDGAINTNNNYLALIAGDIININNDINIGNSDFDLIGNKITQTNGSISVDGNINLNALTDISLASPNNQLNNLGFLTNNISVNNNGETNLLTSVATGIFELRSNGVISQSGSITIGGTTSLDAGSSDIKLSDFDNQFNDLAFTANNVSIGSGSNINLLKSSTNGNLRLFSEGLITQSGILTINGDASFTSNLANAGTASVTNTSPTNIGYSIIGGNFILNSATPISQAPGEPLQVAGDISVNGADSTPLTNSIGLASIEETLPNGDVIVTKVGTVNLDAQTVSGNLIVNSLPVGVAEFTEVFEPAAIILNQNNSFGGTLRFRTNLGGANTVEVTPGITQNGTQIVGNTAILNANGGEILLDDAANQFGSINFSGNNVILTEQNETNLEQSEASGNLTLNSGGLITQTGPLTITGNAQFTTTLPQAGNVLLTNSLDTVLGNSLIGGDFTIDSGGEISQIPGGILQVAGETNPQNNSNFVGNDNIIPRLNLPNGDVIITEVGPIILDAETFSDNLTVTSLAERLQFIDNVVYDKEAINLDQDQNLFGGVISLRTDAPTTVVESGTPSITQGGRIQVDGTASFIAEEGRITLDQSTNSFSNLAFNSGDILINEGNNTNLLNSTATGNLELTSGGSINQSGRLIAEGTTSFTSLQADAPINLTSANQFSEVIELSTIGNGDASLLNTLENTQLGQLKIGGNLAITSGGGISQTTPLTITGITSLNAENQDILLTQNNNFSQLIIQGGSQVTINDINDISLDNSRVFGRITIEAGDNITTQDIDSLSGLIELISHNGSIDTTAGTLSSSLSTGNGGNVILSAGENLNVGNIDADGLVGGNISLSGEDTISINQSRIASFSTGQGTGGGIDIHADLVEVVSGGRIVSSTSGSGNAGNILIKARELHVQSISDQITVITTNTTQDSTGNGGDIIIKASESVKLIGNQQDEFTPDLTDQNAVFEAVETPVGLTTASFGSGKAGNLIIETEQFTIRDRAGAAAASLSSMDNAGAGGEIRVFADIIKFEGQAGLATTTFGSAEAGDVIINTDNITLLDGAVISADALGDPDIVGQAGNIFITAQTLLLDNRSRLSTTTQSGDGGDITLDNLDLLLLRNGDGVGGISTTAGTEQRGGDGGNVKIDADLIIGIAGENSDITANAFSGRGGRIEIETTLILGLEFRDELTRLSDITASSEIGVDGEVVIDDLGIDPVQAAAELSTDTENPPLSQGCQPGMDGRGRFINAGRGGIRPNPSDPISSSVGWEDIQPATSQDNEQPEETTPPDVIVEAEGWYINEQDQVVLYANIPSIEFNCQSR